MVHYNRIYSTSINHALMNAFAYLTSQGRFCFQEKYCWQTLNIEHSRGIRRQIYTISKIATDSFEHSWSGKLYLPVIIKHLKNVKLAHLISIQKHDFNRPRHCQARTVKTLISVSCPISCPSSPFYEINLV